VGRKGPARFKTDIGQKPFIPLDQRPLDQGGQGIADGVRFIAIAILGIIYPAIYRAVIPTIIHRIILGHLNSSNSAAIFPARLF
jgi:hypothetical protein